MKTLVNSSTIMWYFRADQDHGPEWYSPRMLVIVIIEQWTRTLLTLDRRDSLPGSNAHSSDQFPTLNLSFLLAEVQPTRYKIEQNESNY